MLDILYRLGYYILYRYLYKYNITIFLFGYLGVLGSVGIVGSIFELLLTELVPYT